MAVRIEFGDNGKVARDKINSIIDEVNASIPSIGENWHRYIGGVDTGYNAIGFTIKEGDNLIKEANKEIFTNLQFEENLTPTSWFPIGVTVGNVSQDNGRTESGILINARTNNSYARILYGSSGKVYLDGGLWVFKSIATTEDVLNSINTLRGELAAVAFSGKSSDLNNDAGFNSVPVLTEEQYEELPGTWGDDKRYFCTI